MFLSEFLDENAFEEDEAFLAAFPHPFLLEEGALFAGGGLGGEDRRLFLLAGQRVLGRTDSADLTVPDPSVSSRHLSLSPPDGDGPWTVTDLGSTNGTFLNGVRLEPREARPLVDQTVIGIGPCQSFVYLEPASFRALQVGREPPPVGSKRPTEPLKVLADEGQGEAAPAEDVDLEGSILYLCCGDLRPLRIEPGQPVVIGRSGGDADFVLPHPAVSRCHAELTYLEDGVYVRDLGSANGVLLGDMQVGEEAVRVPLGAVIRISDFRLTLRPQPQTDGPTFALERKAMQRVMDMDLAELPLRALLSTIEKKLKSGTLKVLGEEVQGDIAFHAGRPYRAETACGARGAEAIRRMLTVEQGKLLVDPNEREPGERLIQEGFSELL